MSRYEKVYTFDLSQYDTEDTVGHARCRACRQVDNEWQCEIHLDVTLVNMADLDPTKAELKAQFEADLQDEFGAERFHWKGERRSILLQKGDRIQFEGQEGEVVYAIPETQRYGIKSDDGHLINLNLRSLKHFLYKKI